MDGQNVLYSQHVVSGMSGPMNLGHHAMLKFPDAPGSGRVSTSRFVYGQVFPGAFELPEQGGYSWLKPGAEFDSLEKVPTITGERADLTAIRPGAASRTWSCWSAIQDVPFAWTAVTFPQERYVWFALKDPRILRETIFWLSNGGRHYPPWSGRHVNVMGLEEVTSYFHLGLAESARTRSRRRAFRRASRSIPPSRSWCRISWEPSPFPPASVGCEALTRSRAATRSPSSPATAGGSRSRSTWNF